MVVSSLMQTRIVSQGKDRSFMWEALDVSMENSSGDSVQRVRSCGVEGLQTWIHQLDCRTGLTAYVLCEDVVDVLK